MIKDLMKIDPDWEPKALRFGHWFYVNSNKKLVLRRVTSSNLKQFSWDLYHQDKLLTSGSEVIILKFLKKNSKKL